MTIATSTPFAVGPAAADVAAATTAVAGIPFFDAAVAFRSDSNSSSMLL